MRFDYLQVKKQEANKIAVKLKKEKQFNRKVEMNTRLKKLKQEIKTLE